MTWTWNNKLSYCWQSNLYPLSPDSDQHQNSSSSIDAYLTSEVMKIKDMITQGEFSWYFCNFSPARLKEKYGGKIGDD